MTSIIPLIYSYVNHQQFVRHHYIEFKNFCDRHNIDQSIKYIINTNQYGGSIEFPVKRHDIKYAFYYYKAVDPINNNKLIFIKQLNKDDDEKLDEYDNNKHCAMMSYNDNTTLKLDMLRYNSNCIKTTPEAKTNGTLLLKMIIKFAKYNGFKKIVLFDESSYECLKGDPYSVKYKLKYMHTLTHGVPWYASHGFKFISPDDNTSMEYNKNKMKNLKITDFGLDILMYTIIRNLAINKHHITFAYHDFIIGMYDIMNIYKECVDLDKSLCDFFDIIVKKQCTIMGCIYMDLFNLLGLKHYDTLDMIIEFNENKS